ncbi:MAG: aryl-sulfate sulfotransferase [Ignavibacteria bacterium]|nr:aryl-sulfate sulfotransferase [Ignavibacteria bacterium]
MSQQITVGLITTDSLAYDGYTLLAPIQNANTYLIDKCGYLVHQWTSNIPLGFNARLLRNGNLLRATRLNKSNVLNGAGGGIEIWSWDNELLWSFEISDSVQISHHDAEVMPNGNLLVMIAVEIRKKNVFEAGRDSSTLLNDMWVDKIVEIKPIGTDSAEIIWEWNTWDHLVQDRNPQAANYGVISEHSERVDINYYSTINRNLFRDFTHFNSIDYNPELDQILISARNFDEIWIIDHSTSTIEAKGSVGGRYNKGGDLLYRWGNPLAYKMGLDQDRVFYAQHDAYWIEEPLPDVGKVALFNNGAGRVSENFSSVDVIEPPIDEAGNYVRSRDSAFGPAQLSLRITAKQPSDIYSGIFAGSQFLNNGNVLVAEGVSGEIQELDREGNVHWKYVSPVGKNGPVAQGSLPGDNSIFRANHYSYEYEAFQGKHLFSSNVPIELNPISYNCTSKPIPTSTSEALQDLQSIQAGPNPFTDMLIIRSAVQCEYALYNVSGVLVMKGAIETPVYYVDTRPLTHGVYILRTSAGTHVETGLYLK